MDNDMLLKFDLLSKLKKMGKLNPTTINMILLSPKKAAEAVNQAFALFEMFSSSFPEPAESVDGDIRFANTKNSPVGFNLEDLLQGLIVGSPGSGKSILTYHVALHAMALGAICWMFVKGNDAEKLIRFKRDIAVDDFNGQFRKNLLTAPPNFSRDNWTSIHWDIFIQANSLYDGTKNFLTTQYFDLYEKYKEQNAEPSFFEVHDFLKARKFPAYSRDARYNESALNRIGGILKGSLRDDLDCSYSNLQDFVFQNIIFNYKGLSHEASVYLINALIAWLAAYKEANGVTKTHLIILDDAMFVFDANRLDKRPDMGIGYINHILFETRKYLIKFFVDIQIPSLISKGILGTSNFKCLLNIPNANEMKIMLDILGISDKEQRECACRLDKDKREMIVKVPGYPEPFLASIPESPLALEMDKTRITPEEKYFHNKEILKGFSHPLPRVSCQEINQLNFEAAKPKPDSGQVKVSKDSDSKLDNKISDFLMAVNLNQYKATLTEIYEQANLTAGTGSRIAKKCESKGLIKVIKVSIGKGSPRYPVLTSEAYKVLGIEEKKFYGKGAGIEHVLYQHLIAAYFKDFSPKIELYKGQKHIDVAIEVNNFLIAFEVEMTPVHATTNIKKDIENAKASYVITACKDPKVLGEVQTRLLEFPQELRNGTETILLSKLLSSNTKDIIERICEHLNTRIN